MGVLHFSPTNSIAEGVGRKHIAGVWNTGEVHRGRRRDWVPQLQQRDVVVNCVDVKSVMNEVGFDALRRLGAFVRRQVVFAGPHQHPAPPRLFADAVRCGEDPLWSNERTAAILLLPLGQDCDLQQK